MIPDFKTYITESIWSDIQDRSMGKTVRKEDIHWYTEPFNKIKEMELIDMSHKMDLGVKYLWTPCNFGAESYNQPGLYLTYDEILELNEFLKDTDYEIAGVSAYKSLITKEFYLKTTNGYWDYVFKSANSDTYLHIPGFGYKTAADKLYKPTKTQSLIYGIMIGKNVGYVTINNNKGYWNIDDYTLHNKYANSDRLQIRLVKKS